MHSLLQKLSSVIIKKQKNNTTDLDNGVAVFKITGMHCSSCAMSIDGTLEDIAGVIEATTSYAQGTTKVIFNTDLISVKTLTKAIRDCGYSAKLQ